MVYNPPNTTKSIARQRGECVRCMQGSVRYLEIILHS
nr:MAG TPA: hypothetical protein [Caudoviricetes sp.]